MSAFGLDVFGRITVNMISLTILSGTHTMLNAAMDTDQSLWTPQRRRSLLMLKVWLPWLDPFSLVVGQMVGYLMGMARWGLSMSQPLDFRDTSVAF